MCKWGNTDYVLVKVPADLSCDGQEKWKSAKIDSCIVGLVQALQSGGVDMRGSCCGHFDDFGYVHLQDGRVLVITDESYFSEFRWPVSVVKRFIRLRLRYYLEAMKNPNKL